jgi:hypothetical protein
MTRKIAIAALVMLSLGGCVVVPVGSPYPHFGWHDRGWDHRYYRDHSGWDHGYYRR